MSYNGQHWLPYLGFLLGCTQSADIPGNQQAVDEITKMLHEYHRAIEQGGLKAEFEYLDDTDEFFWVPPGYRSALDYDSVAAILNENDRAMSKISLHWDTLKVFSLRSDLAQFYGTITMMTEDTSGNSTTGHLVETGLVIKRSDGWKLLSGQSAFFSF